MVRINQQARKGSRRRLCLCLQWTLAFFCLVVLFVRVIPEQEAASLEATALKELAALEMVALTPTCPYTSLTDLDASELYPKANAERHTVDPPVDDGVTLVCCDTTAGPLSILAHHTWAPTGARRFLDMVESSYFNTGVPLMRCVRNFLCQFGLNGQPEAMKPYLKSIPDDTNWLPEGKENRQNDLGVKRFQRGYLAYAGSGPHSRNLQFIVALNDSGPLAGGSPWEVPWGEVVGAHSFETLEKIYTGYGENGPKQGSLHKIGAIERVRENFPKLDFVNSCRIVAEQGEQGVSGSTANPPNQ